VASCAGAGAPCRSALRPQIGDPLRDRSDPRRSSSLGCSYTHRRMCRDPDTRVVALVATTSPSGRDTYRTDHRAFRAGHGVPRRSYCATTRLRGCHATDATNASAAVRQLTLITPCHSVCSAASLFGIQRMLGGRALVRRRSIASRGETR